MGGFVHLELNSTDHKLARKFYSKVFGWQLHDMKMDRGVYSMVKGEATPGIGLQQAAMPEMPSSWIGYIAVDDVKKTVAKAAKAGATVTAAYFEVPGMGEGAWLVDPTGAPVAIWHSFAKPGKKSGRKQPKKKDAKKQARKKATKEKAKAGKKPKKKAGKKSRKATRRATR